MKTAISIPDDVFARADAFAKRRKMSRSALFTAAVAEYVQQRTAQDVTRQLNAVYSREDSTLDPVLEAIQTEASPGEDWQ
jgi:metal-responsive CopG/Arc/MetJ family transcriptional regulator